MTRSPFPDPRTLAALALLSVIAGCGGSADAPLDMGSLDMGPPDQPFVWRDPCDEFGPTVLYRITDLHVPTLADVNSGVPVGHNVDGADEVCDVPDFPGGVDNSLIDLSSELPLFNPPAPSLDLQAVIDAALDCPTNADPAECTRLDLIVRVSTGVFCVRIAIEDGAGTTLAGPFVGSLDDSGNFRGAVSSFDLTIPYHAPSGPVDIRLAIAAVIMTATLSENAMTNIVLGGAVVRGSFEAMLMELLPLLADDLTFEDIQPLLADLYDVQASGECSALSVGFTATATRVAAP